MSDEWYQACLSPSGQMSWRAEKATEVIAGGKGGFEPRSSSQPSASLADSHQPLTKMIQATSSL